MSSENKHYAGLWELLEKSFPDARCELNYRNIYELAISVILSAQTTDKKVNKQTPALFKRYPNLDALAAAKVDEVIPYLRQIGLYRMKANNIINFAKRVQEVFNHQIPQTIEELVLLPGVGRKTANVIVSEGFGQPGLAVDTHVSRVSKRLGLALENDSPEVIEMKLKKILPPEKWHSVHHQLIFMGRYLCHARNPLCDTCQFRDKYCQVYKQEK